MAKILNSVLIGVVAFFAFLAAAFAVGGLRDGEGSATAHASLSQVTAQWGDPGKDGTPIELRVALDNPGPPLTAVAVRYVAEVDGEVADEGTFAFGRKIAAGSNTTLTFAATLDERFASDWWPRQASRDGHILVLRGELELREADGPRFLPFEWESTWAGDVPSLFAPLADCRVSQEPVCLDATVAHWQGDALRATLTLRNQGWQDLYVRGGTLTLSLGGIEVATAEVDDAALPGDGMAELPVLLSFDADALDAWWQDHVARCEESDAVAQVDLRFEDGYGWDAGTASWQTPAATLRTGFLCNGVP